MTAATSQAPDPAHWQETLRALANENAAKQEQAPTRRVRQGDSPTAAPVPKAAIARIWPAAGTSAVSQGARSSTQRPADSPTVPQTGDKTRSSKTAENGFTLIPIGELLSRPDVPPDYLVDGLLIRGTLSLAAAKPKVGKSTFARGLCLAVARGEAFLGRTTRQGSCIYLALEERYEEVTSDFRAMGAEAKDLIEIHAAAAPAEAIFALIALVRRRRPALVVIDPLFRLAHIRDEKAYAETYAALGPLIDLARETDTHIHLTHHSGKSVKADAIDSPLGSTAIGGAVATVIVLSRRESYRTIQTVTRIGPVIDETVLTFDEDTRLLSIGGTRDAVDSEVLEKEIAEYLQSAGERTEPEINEEVEGRTTTKRKALRALVKKGVVERTGTGKSGSPFKYLFSCSQHIPGTREQDVENVPQTRASIDESLVPENPENQCLVPDGFSGEKGGVSDAQEDGQTGDAAEPDAEAGEELRL